MSLRPRRWPRRPSLHQHPPQETGLRRICPRHLCPPCLPSTTADKALLDGLLAHSAAGYSVVEKTAVYPIVVSQEGTGSGLFIAFDRNGKLDSIQIYEAAEEGEPGLKE